MSFSSSMFSGGFNEFLDLGLSPLWWVAVSVDVTEALKIPFFWKKKNLLLFPPTMRPHLIYSRP